MSVAATIHGADSNATREKLITDLLRRCGTASEVKYLLRTLSGGLRIGMGETSIVGAAARAALCDDEIMDVAAVKRAEALGRSMYSSRCDPSQFATKLAGTYDFRLQHGQAAAFTMCEAQAHPAPLIPARAMLASPAKSVDEAVQFFVKNSENGRRDIVCQSKYDGERAQIHVVVVKDEESSSSSSSSSMRAAGEDRTTYTRVYSRVGEDNSLRYQQIAERVGELLLQHHSDGGGEPLVSCILDGEVAAVDRETNRLLPFQTLTRRTRDGRDNKVAAKQSHDDDGDDIDDDDIDDDDIDDDIDQPAATLKSSSSSSSSVPLPPCDVCFYAFDLLEYNGRSLVDQPLRERRKIMQQIIHPMVGELEVGEELQIQVGEGLLEAPATIHAALEAAVKSGCEGLVVKALDGKGTEYKCGERTRNWLKLKKDYVDSVDGALDTFDLVVLGAYYGKGKRQGLYGSFLMGCLNEEQEGGYRTVCKVGTGFTDQMLKDIHFELSQLQVPHHRRSGDDQDEERKKSNDCSNAYDVRTNIRPMPDVWFEPKKVWEVRAADISLSKAHSSCHDQLKRLGHVNDGQSSGGRGGLALRFPRFVRFREDKNIHDATKESQMLDMYLDQTTQPQEKK